jgi:hypothetical protein
MEDLETSEQREEVWEAEVRAMSERLSRQSRRSAIFGFLGGMAVMGGLVILIWGAIERTRSLSAVAQEKTTQAAQAQQQAAQAMKTAATVTQTLSQTVVNPAAATALDQALKANPNAANLLVRVYIHIHAQDQRPRAAQLADALRKAGFIVPGIDVQLQSEKQTVVHYYDSSSQSLADANAIAKAVWDAGIPCVQREVPKSTTDKLMPRAYGLWLAASIR